MKKVRFLAMLLAAMLLATCALAEAPADPIVLKIGDVSVPLSEAQAYFDQIFQSNYGDAASNGMTLTAAEIVTIRDQVLEALAMQKVLDIKAKELGLDVITDADREATRAAAQKDFDEGITGYAEYYGMSIEDATAELAAYGVTPETLYESYLADLPFTRLMEAETKDITVTDEEVDAEYNLYVENDKSTYENDIASYELYKNYYGQDILYTPAGFRMVKHILLEVPAALQTEMGDYEADMKAVSETISQLNEELEALENPDEAAATDTTTQSESKPRTAEEIQADLTAKDAELDEINAKYTAAMDKVIPELKSVTDEIYAKLAAGESFDSLIVAYGKDPGMESNPNGYMVHKDSILWDPIFTEGAMVLEKVGDVGQPVLGGFGVHIIQYVSDVEPGAVPMSEAIRAQIYEALLGDAQNTAFYNRVVSWLEAAHVETNADLIVLPEATATEPAADATAAPNG